MKTTTTRVPARGYVDVNPGPNAAGSVATSSAEVPRSDLLWYVGTPAP